jgi:hypothetical protein
MQSSIFKLTNETAAAFERHQADIEAATPEDREAAIKFVLDHLADVGLAIGFRNARAAEMAQRQIEHDQAVKNTRIATTKAAFKAASVKTLPGSVGFFCGVLNGAVVALDAAGKVGTRAAEMRADAAVTAIKQSGRGDFHVQLPSGIIAVRVSDPDIWARMTTTWGILPTVTWTLGGTHYALFAGSVPRSIDTGAIAFTTSARCGSDAVWSIEPSDVQLDDDARLPALPDAVQSAIEHCAKGSEALLFSFLTR